MHILTDLGDVYFQIDWDIQNKTYDVIFLSKKEYEKALDTEVKSPKEIIIEKNNNNSIPYKYVDEADIVKEYFNDYINSAIDFPEDMYNILDKEYREAKFGSLDEFKKYVNGNVQLKKLYNCLNLEADDYGSYMEYYIEKDEAKLENYIVQEETEEYTRYVCIDSFGNYYIFHVTDTMEYSLVLDTYTINIPEFTEKYEKSNAQEKVILNINKFMQSINDKDYKFAYSILADSFKENKFKTIGDFQKYIEDNFFEKNEFSYIDFDNEAETYYTYTVRIKDANRKYK